MSVKKKHMTKSQKAKPAKTTAKGNKVSVRKGAIKPKGKPKPRKPKLPIFNCSKCENPFTDRKAGDWFGPEGQLTWHCSDCLPRARKPKADTGGAAWYVLQVEPGTDSKVRKGILRTRRIESLEDRVLKVVIATTLKEVITEEKGPVVAKGWELEVEAAKVAAIRAARALAGMKDGEVGPDGASAVPGYRWAVSRNHDVEKGYGWNWTVREKHPNPQAIRKVVKCKKYPGYVFVHCKWDGEIDRWVRKVRGAWEFLLRPVINNALVSIRKFKNGRFGWTLRHPETREVIDQFPPPRKTRKGYDTRGAALHAGGLVRESYEQFHPVALHSKEACDLLMQQRAINQVCKDKEEKDRILNAAKVGDTVRINHPHPFAGVECKVGAVTKDKADLKTQLMGVEVPIPGVNLWQLEVVQRARKEK